MALADLAGVYLGGHRRQQASDKNKVLVVSLNTKRASGRDPLCWVLAGLSPCRNRGKYWVYWNPSYPAVRVCGLHKKHSAMGSLNSDRHPADPPDWATA